MNQMYFNLLDYFVVVYLDGVLVYSASLSEHLCHLHSVLQCLYEKCFCAKLTKYAFFQRSIEYLRQIVGAGSVWCDPSKLKTIHE